MKLVRESLNESALNFPKLEPGWSNESIDNCQFYIRACEEMIENSGQISVHDKYKLNHIINLLNTAGAEGDKLTSLNVQDQIKTIKKLLALMKKEYAYAVREYKNYKREEKQREQAEKILNKKKTLNVSYRGDADEELLNKVISKLNLYNRIKPNSVIELYADNHSKTEWVGHSIEQTTIKADGWITIDNDEHEFKNVFVKMYGYDHFPPS